jgi:TIGR03009 family protein
MSRLLKLTLLGIACGSLVLCTFDAAHSQTSGRKKRPAQPAEVVPAAAPGKANLRKKSSPAPRQVEEPPDDADRDDAEQYRDEPQEADTQRDPRRARPRGKPMTVELDPELEEILREWEATSSRFAKLIGNCRQVKVNHTFGVETHSEGIFGYEAPDKGFYHMHPKKISKSEASTRKTAEGELYTVESGTEENWVCTGKEIIKIDSKRGEYEIAPIPEDMRGKNIIEGPLPFLFGMKADQARRRYYLQLLKANDDFIVLKVIPRWTIDSANYREAQVKIKRSTFVPSAVMLTDTSGEAVTYHLFTNVEVNPRKNFFDILKEDPFKPSLKGLKRVMSDKMPPGMPEEPPEIDQPPRKSGSGSAGGRIAPRAERPAGAGRKTQSR